MSTRRWRSRSSAVTNCSPVRSASARLASAPDHRPRRHPVSRALPARDALLVMSGGSVGLRQVHLCLASRRGCASAPPGSRCGRCNGARTPARPSTSCELLAKDADAWVDVAKVLEAMDVSVGQVALSDAKLRAIAALNEPLKERRTVSRLANLLKVSDSSLVDPCARRSLQEYLTVHGSLMLALTPRRPVRGVLVPALRQRTASSPVMPSAHVLVRGGVHRPAQRVRRLPQGLLEAGRR